MKYIAVIDILLVVSVILSVAIVAIIIGVVLLVRKLKSKKEQAVEKIWLVVRENEEKQRKTMQEGIHTCMILKKGILFQNY